MKIERDKKRKFKDYDSLTLYHWGFNSTNLMGQFTHNLTGDKVYFKFSLEHEYSGEDLMRVIFNVVKEIGKKEKLKEFRDWLGIRNN
jgi:hypothetical protein